MIMTTTYGQVGNRPAGQPDADWCWTDYSLCLDDVRAEARAHHDADCSEPDYEPLQWALRLDDGSILVV